MSASDKHKIEVGLNSSFRKCSVSVGVTLRNEPAGCII